MKSISLYIGGTRKTGSSGFGFIIGVGVLAGNEHEGDMDLSPISRASTDENPVITIKNTEEYVFYKMWDSSICPSDAKLGSRGGSLAIGVTIPSQARLSGNKSPYRLLMDIYEKFLEIGTEEIEIETEEKKVKMRKFRDVDLDKAEFVKIIESYPLEEANIKPAVMKGDTVGEIQMSPEKMEDFFRDTQYPEFAHHKAIEVTTKGKNMFPNLEIPRPVSYEVFVDGEPTNNFLKDLNDRYNARKNATEDYKYDSLSFSLGELLDREDGTRKNQSGTVVVMLDKNNRRIDCTMKPKPILYKIRVKCSDNSDNEVKKLVEKWLKDNSLRIRLDGKDLNLGDAAIKPSDAKLAVKDNSFDVYPKEWNGYVYSVAKAKLEEYDEEVVITLKATKTKEENREERSRDGGQVKHNRKDLIIGGIIGLLVGIGGTLGTLKIVEMVSYKTKSKAENSAYNGANASSDTIVMKNYIDAYSAPQFKYPNQDHLSAIQEKLDMARMEAVNLNEMKQAEEAAYNKCKDETLSLNERIAACEAYLKANYATHKNEIEQLKGTLAAQKTSDDNAQAENKAFETCKKAQSQAYPSNYTACQNYLKQYPQGANKATVDEYIRIIMNGRNDILSLLNDNKLTDFNNKYGNPKWKSYITEQECNAVSYVMKPVYKNKDGKQDKYLNRQAQTVIDESKYKKTDGSGFTFTDLNQVIELKRTMDDKVNKSIPN